jgi:hypothetical protein
VSNGSTAFLDNVDGWSALARRYRDILGDLNSNLWPDLSVVGKRWQHWWLKLTYMAKSYLA